MEKYRCQIVIYLKRNLAKKASEYLYMAKYSGALLDWDKIISSLVSTSVLELVIMYCLCCLMPFHLITKEKLYNGRMQFLDYYD
jgi:hypothetical protein